MCGTFVRKAESRGGTSGFSSAIMYAAARLYYQDELSQQQIADRLGISRTTVSRLLQMARDNHIVRIQVVEPTDVVTLSDELAQTLGLRRVVVVEASASRGSSTGETAEHLIERMVRGSKTGENPLNLQYDFVYADYPAPSQEQLTFRRWDPLTELIEPPYVCYHRLYFEQINAERYGWDLGLVHPLVSASVFFWDVAWLPYHAFTEPLRRYECNAGYCLPGDAVPLLFYPPELNLAGVLAEAAVVGLGFAIFP